MDNPLIEFIQSMEAVSSELGVLTPDTLLSQLHGWTALTQLQLLEMIHEQYDVDLEQGEMAACQTPEELFELIQSHLPAGQNPAD